MKKLIYLLPLILLFSCGGNNPSDEIGLTAGFAHVSQSLGYWVWVIVAAVIAAAFVIYCVKEQFWNGWVALGIAALLLIAIFYRPVEVGVNTTNEQAQRGVFIGY